MTEQRSLTVLDAVGVVLYRTLLLWVSVIAVHILADPCSAADPWRMRESLVVGGMGCLLIPVGWAWRYLSAPCRARPRWLTCVNALSWFHLAMLGVGLIVHGRHGGRVPLLCNYVMHGWLISLGAVCLCAVSGVVQQALTDRRRRTAEACGRAEGREDA